MQWGGDTVLGGEEDSKATAQHPDGMLKPSTPTILLILISPFPRRSPFWGTESPPWWQVGNNQLELYLAGATSLPSISPPQA